MPRILSSSDPRARDVIDQFCARAAEQIAVMATGIDGVELLVFTGGIGENSPEVRRNICMRLEWMGLELDEQANTEQRQVISAKASGIEVRVVATDEELVIARHTCETIRAI
jgi:acetate kinase